MISGVGPREVVLPGLQQDGKELPELNLGFENSGRVRDGCLLWGHVEVIIGCIRDSRLRTFVRCFAAVSGGFTAFRLQSLDARNVLHHAIAGMTGRGQQ